MGAIDEASYLRLLSAHTGLATESFAALDRHDSPLADHQIPHAAASGIVPLRRDGQLIWTLAPRQWTARALCQLVADYPEVRPHARLASADSLQRFLLRQGGRALADAATQGLRQRHPEMSAAPRAAKAAIWMQRARRGGGVLALALLPPLVAGEAWSLVLALWFLAFVALRLLGSLWPRRRFPRRSRRPDDQLPVYSVVVALYREAGSVAPLVQAIHALDYPREKLDVILVVEPDDRPTRAAIARLGVLPHLRVLIAPALPPRTKPKALNCALPFARGAFLAVFDAEDRPTPDQLREAVDAFARGGARIGCTQARLCVDNLTNSWLSRMFAVEYAAQFDVFLPGMADLGLPLPLGGSSNHFRTAVLRQVGGCDPYNVTEDADLGFRLARFGYHSTTFASTTFEEAPIAFKAWLKQRSRWMKGWIQTWCVHMRRPQQLWRDAGAGGFFALNMLVGGSVLTALAHPVLLYELLAALLGPASAPPSWPDDAALLHGLTIAAGYGSTVAIGLLGLAQRGRLRRGWILALTPLYWVCLSIAAWRALLQFVWNPYHWEKTDHGLARRPAAVPVPRWVQRWRQMEQRLETERDPAPPDDAREP
ncbi:MAG TPA: glycosyltransferase family 2 protein [Rhodopseudomonas sp.]|uniref:glycosyltransferase family 2 protein n=1 Tax=Rhodopseudomonas sp. TaxID=1078 RepID=UPI002ED7E27A